MTWETDARELDLGAFVRPRADRATGFCKFDELPEEGRALWDSVSMWMRSAEQTGLTRERESHTRHAYSLLKQITRNGWRISS